MGNLPTKRSIQVKPSQQKNEPPIVNNNVSQLDQIKDKIDPLAVFGLKDKTREEVIEYLQGPHFMKQYRELLRTHHPDRGGSALKCSIVNFAYERLKTARDNLLAEANYRPKNDVDLRKEYQEEVKYTEKEVKKAVQSLMKESNPGDFHKKFNEAFTLAKMSDYTDDGYEAGERTKNTKRAPVSVKRTPGVNGSNLNEMFEANTKVNTALVVHENKQPEGISSLKHAVYEYGKKKETDFGRMTKGAADYGIAYAGERLVDIVSATPKDKQLTGKVNMDMAKKMRSAQNINPEMTEQERDVWAQEQEELQKNEEERRANIVEMDYQMGQKRNIFLERMLDFQPS